MGEPLDVRRAGSADASAVRDLTRAAYARWISVIGREPRPMGVDYEAAVRENLIDMLFLEGRLAALIQMIPEPEHLLIDNIAVGPDHQGRGMGRVLMAHAETVARDLGLPGLRLFTHGLMTANVRFYQALGYRIDREEPFLEGTVIHMSKALAS